MKIYLYKFYALGGVAMKRIILFVVLVVFIFSNLNGEIKYKVSGKVTRKDKGVKNVVIEVTTYIGSSKMYDNLPYSKRKFRRKCTTNKDGYFSFYLKSGKYYIDVEDFENTLYAKPLEYLPIGPTIIEVKNKNIRNIRYEFYTLEERIEKYKYVLSEVPDNIPTIQYHWGKVQIHSEEECRKIALWRWRIFKRMHSGYSEDEIEPELLRKTKIAKPIIYYDFRDNPVLYQYPFKYLGVGITCISVYAVGVKPECDYSLGEIFFRTIAEIKKDITAARKLKLTSDKYIKDVIDEISKKEKIGKNQIEVVKLICFGAVLARSPFFVLLRIIPKNELVLSGLEYYGISYDKFRKSTQLFDERIVTLHYIESLLTEKNRKKRQ